MAKKAPKVEKEDLMLPQSIDIKENYLLTEYPEALDLLLIDQTTHKNIFWASKSYEQLRDGYKFFDSITREKITGENGNVIKPRAAKSKEEQTMRVKVNAEVFTPSWICNKQNNMVDQSWFGRKDVFNKEDGTTWHPTEGKIRFPNKNGKSWIDYVSNNAMEISCGEALYLASRYDTITGQPIELGMRIGLLDRKMRIVGENTETEEDWICHAINAVKSTYGYDWQGDNVLLARESILLSFIEYYKARFEKKPSVEVVNKVAYIITWNIFQMDGIKFVVPESCHDVVTETDIFGNEGNAIPCPGCTNNRPHSHTGIYSLIADWSIDSDEPIEIVEFHTLHK